MRKVAIGKHPYIYPVPTVLLGATADEKVNFSTIGNCGIISVHPPIVYASSDKSHFTNKGIREHGVFSLNIPSTANLVKTDYCGLVSGAEVDKSNLFKVFYESNNFVPMIEECTVNISCSVFKTIEIFHMEMFIAEIVESFIDESCLVDGKPNIKAIDPIIYSIKGNYWNIGEEIGNAFSDGKRYESG